MAEKIKPRFFENVSKFGFWGGALAGLRILAVNLLSLPAANFLTAGVGVGAALGGTVWLIDKVVHPASS